MSPYAVPTARTRPRRKVRGAEAQVLKIVKQLEPIDGERIAVAMGVSLTYVTNLCNSLLRVGYISLLADEYRMTPEGSRMLPPSVRKDSVFDDIEKMRDNIEMKRGAIVGELIHGSEERYSEGGIVGEIKMKADIPPREKVEAALKTNPQCSYEEMEAWMTSHTLVCPAKGKEVTWHYCAACPHQDGINLEQWTVQCKYHFTERRIEMIYGKEEIEALAMNGGSVLTDLHKDEGGYDLPHVACPATGKVIGIDRCATCRYQRGTESPHKSKKTGVVGWVLCGAPHDLGLEPEEDRKVLYGGKKMRIIPQMWE